MVRQGREDATYIAPRLGLLVVVVEIVVLVATRSRNSCSGTIVGVGRRSEICCCCRHRYAVVGSTRITRHSGTLVTRCKYGNTTLDNIIWRACIVDEVVQGLLLDRRAGNPLLLRGEARLSPIVLVRGTRHIAPAALQHHGTIICRILHCTHHIDKARRDITREDLAHHNAHSAIGRSITTCNGADADTIIIYSGNSSCNMGSVARVEVAVPGNLACLLHEVVAIVVAIVAVAVVIHKRVLNLVRINPDIGSQIGMLDIDSLVENCHNNRLVARRSLPRLDTLHIGTCQRLDVAILGKERAVILQVPLMSVEFIVERLCQSSCIALHGLECLLRNRHGLAGIGTLHGAVEIDLLHLAELRKATRHLLSRDIFAVAYSVPAIESITHSALFVALVTRKDARKFTSVNLLQQGINSCHTAARKCRAYSSRLFEQCYNLRRKFHQNLSTGIRLLIGWVYGNRHILHLRTRSEDECRRQ